MVERRITIDGIPTQVIECGPAGGGGASDAAEAIVLLHGAPGSARVWADLQPRLGAVARTVAFDLPGYGGVAPPAAFPHTIDAYAAFVGAALDQLGIARAHLVMNDIGGAGLRWAADHPGRVGSTVQLNTGIVNQLKRWHLVGLLLRTPLVGAVGERLGRPLLGPTLRVFDPLPARERQALAAGFDRYQRRALRTMYRAVPVDAGAALAPRLARMERPALVVWGARDRFVPLAKADQRAALPHARVELLPASGHYPHLDDPEAVARLVVPFLREQLTAR
jgi:pimeloyl-ACP methyl ester carboxylesterase